MPVRSENQVLAGAVYNHTRKCAIGRMTADGLTYQFTDRMVGYHEITPFIAKMKADCEPLSREMDKRTRYAQNERA